MDIRQISISGFNAFGVNVKELSGFENLTALTFFVLGLPYSFNSGLLAIEPQL